MLDKAKPTKQDLRNLAKGLEAAATLSGQVAALDQAIEASIKALSLVDEGARRELSRTQLTLGVGNAYLLRLVTDGNAYLKVRAGKPAAKPKAAAKKKAPAKKPAAKKPATKKKSAEKRK